MKVARRVALLVLLAGLAVPPLPAVAGTIAPGETRVAEGTITAVDVAYRTIVIDVPSGEGPLTVGVTLAPSVKPKADGQTISLSDVVVGERAVLTYTREDGKLVGTDVRIRR